MTKQVLALLLLVALSSGAQAQTPAERGAKRASTSKTTGARFGMGRTRTHLFDALP